MKLRNDKILIFGGAHQPDEYINIDGFLQEIELTALMLLECDKTKY